jgi:capsular exopolysaccharide synthesis family protein
VHLRDHWKVAWQGRWTVIAVFSLVVLSVLAWSFLQTPTYRATAVVEVQPQARRVGPGQDVSGLGVASYGWFAEERYQNTQIEVIKSRAVSQRAFDMLGLRASPQLAESKDPVGTFAKSVRVEPRRETGLIEISVEGPDRDEIARWANAVASAYVDRNLERARENATNAVASISNLMEPLKERLTQAEQDKFNVLRETEIYNPENQQEIVKQKLSKLNEELSSTQVTVGKLETLLGKLKDIREHDGDPMGIPDLAQDPVLQEWNRQRVSLEREIESAKVTYRAGHPAYQEKVSELEKVQQRIRDQVALALGRIQNEYELALRNETFLKDEIRKAEELSYRVGVATSRYSVVKTDAETRKQIYDAITKTLNEITVGADLLANNVSILDQARPPLNPVRPRKRLNLVMGGMIGMFLGLGMVFFLDYLDNTFRTPEDVEQRLKLNTLAVVPKYAAAEVGSHAVKEAYQSLRTGLIFLSRNRERQVILVTSSGPQEGKSSTVAQLARTLASAGDRVILLDCDLRRPTQHIHLGLQREHGLTNYLAGPRGDEDWTPYVKTVGPANLHAMTCGPIPPNPPELLGSDRFVRLLADLRKGYDWVLLDSPPGISLADAVLLSSKADMVLLVIQHNHTDRDLATRTLFQFRNVGASVVGAILNNVDLERAYKKDYYYAGYYYYGADQKREKRRRSGQPKGGAGVGAATG